MSRTGRTNRTGRHRGTALLALLLAALVLVLAPGAASARDPGPDGPHADRSSQGLRPRVLGARAGRDGGVAAQLSRRLLPACRTTPATEGEAGAAGCAHRGDRRADGRPRSRPRSPTTTWTVVKLENAPRVAIYVPPSSAALGRRGDRSRSSTPRSPTRSSATRRCWPGSSPKYDWLHLHHEDFTGQYGKFYRRLPRSRVVLGAEAIRRGAGARQALGFTKVSEHKKAVARAIKDYVARGGFLFAMCSATDTFDIALAAERRRHRAGRSSTAIRPTPIADAKLDFEPDARVHELHAGDEPARLRVLGHRHDQLRATLRGRGGDYFTLFDFSAKQDPVPTMLMQDHVAVSTASWARRPASTSGCIKTGRDDPGGDAEGADEVEVPARQLRQGHLHLLRRPRPRGLPARGWRSADRPRAPQELAGLPADPEQRPLPGGGEEGTEDVGVARPASRGAANPRSVPLRRTRPLC